MSRMRTIPITLLFGALSSCASPGQQVHPPPTTPPIASPSLLPSPTHPSWFATLMPKWTQTAAAASPTPFTRPSPTAEFNFTPACSISEADRMPVEEALYRQLLPDLDRPTSLFVLEESRALYRGERLTPESWTWVSQTMTMLPDDVFGDYLSANTSPPDVPPGMNLLASYYLIRTSEWGEPEGGWDLFHERFPSASGYYVISRAGLNCTLNKALVYVGKATPGTADSLPGWRAILYLLSLADGTWRVDQWTFVSMS